MATRVPVEKGLFTIPASPNEKASLLASKCESCGEVFFPSQDSCAKCGKKSFSAIRLGRRGKVVNSLIVWYPPQLYKGPVPYVVAQVKLPGPAVVPAILKGWEGKDPPPAGLEVELDLEKIGAGEQGEEILTYVFKPVQVP